MSGGIFIALISSLLAVLFSIIVASWIMKKSPGNEDMQRISSYIQEGATAFLKREYRAIFWFVFVVVLLIIIGLGFEKGFKYSVWTAISYIVGAVLSLSAGWFGMKISTRSNARTTEAARKSFKEALEVAFFGGSVMGHLVVGLGLLGLSLMFIILSYVFSKGSGLNYEIASLVASVLAGFSMGASSVALFARVGGGIYTKSADIGADLVGKVEAGIPEDDPRNPAVIADNVGDNVGDCAGMGADLYESYVGSILSAIVISSINKDIKGIFLAFLLAGFGILSSILGAIGIKVIKTKKPENALTGATVLTAVLFAISAFVLTKYYYGNFKLFWAVLSGLASGVIIGYVAQYYSTGSRIEEIAHAAKAGVAPNIIAGISTGMASTVVPLVSIAIAIIISYYVGGFYGIALAGIGMLSITGMTVTVDAYGPIADNAGGIAEMAHLQPEVRKITDSLDAAGNTTAAIGKGFAIGSAALTALALFAAYTQAVKNLGIEIHLTLLDSKVIAGLFIGAMVPFFFSSSVLKAVSRNAQLIVEEVRRQFREIKGLLEGKAKADYARAVDITTRGALKEMIKPGVVAFILPLIVGILLGTEALGGFLAGALLTGVPLAIFMANSGAAWDNAKKWVEAGNLGGKGSPVHKATVEGDTVGDPFKDSAGPSLNILLKLMSIVSLVFLPFIYWLHNTIF